MGSKRFETTGDFYRHGADAMVRCRACRHEARLYGGQMFTLFRAILPIAKAVARLRCSKCGTKGKADMIAVPKA